MQFLRTKYTRFLNTPCKGRSWPVREKSTPLREFSGSPEQGRIYFSFFFSFYISLSLSFSLSFPWPVFEGKAAFVDKIDSFINNGFRYRFHLLLSDPRQNSRFVGWSDPKRAKLDNFEYMNVTFKSTRFPVIPREIVSVPQMFNLSFIFESVEIAVRNEGSRPRLP